MYSLIFDTIDKMLLYRFFRKEGYSISEAKYFRDKFENTIYVSDYTKFLETIDFFKYERCDFKISGEHKYIQPPPSTSGSFGVSLTSRMEDELIIKEALIDDFQKEYEEATKLLQRARNHITKISLYEDREENWKLVNEINGFFDERERR